MKILARSLISWLVPPILKGLALKTLIILYIWSAVAGSGGNERPHYSWMDKGLYGDVMACERAAKRLKLKADQFECIDSGRPINSGK